MAFDLQTQLSKFLADLYAGTLGVNQPLTAVTVLGPGTGAVLTNSATNVLNLAGSFVSTSNITASSGGLNAANTNFIGFTTRAYFSSPSDGNIVVQNNALTIGSQFKADALPTIGSGFGTSPSVTAGSTPLAGQVNVGTGGAATSGVITFGGTAFPSAPFIVVTIGSTVAAFPVMQATATTTQVTITASVAWTASTLVNWLCVGSK